MLQHARQEQAADNNIQQTTGPLLQQKRDLDGLDVLFASYDLAAADYTNPMLITANIEFASMYQPNRSDLNTLPEFASYLKITYGWIDTDGHLLRADSSDPIAATCFAYALVEGQPYLLLSLQENNLTALF